MSDLDLAAQKAETFEVFEQIAAQTSDLDRAVVDFQMVPIAGAARPDDFEAAAAAAGYSVDRFEDEDGENLELSTLPMSLTADAIWAHEEKLSLMAVEFGFRPDGWGFFNEA